MGESAHRLGAGSKHRATIATLRRDTWEVVQRAELPCREVYDLALVPPELVDGLRRGFRTNSSRVLETNQLALFEAAGVAPARIWATADPLPPEACHVRVSADLPRIK